MSKFKVGDIVVPINADHYGDNACMKQLVVTWVSLFAGNDEDDNELVIAGVPGEVARFWNSKNLRLVPTAQPESIPPAVQKPIRRGDLVRYKGEIWVVFSEGEDRHGDYSIASLTGGSDHNWAKIDELTRIGTIRKKVKQLKAQVEDEE